MTTFVPKQQAKKEHAVRMLRALAYKLNPRSIACTRRNLSDAEEHTFFMLTRVGLKEDAALQKLTELRGAGAASSARPRQSVRALSGNGLTQGEERTLKLCLDIGIKRDQAVKAILEQRMAKR
jgi:hypothetical protein